MVQVAKDVGITRALAKFACTLSYEDLPPQVVDMAKYVCLDYLSVAINGSTTSSSQAVVKALKRLGRAWQASNSKSRHFNGGGSVVMGTPYRALPEYAALANGAFSHSLELDDVNNEGSLHPGVVTFSAAFAASDLAPVDGKAFIAAAVTGYDIMVRLGRALKPAKHYGRGFHPTATTGAFGAAALMSRLLGLNEQQHVWALGIAGSQAAGSLEFLADGSWTKRLHPGWSAHSGIIAAVLAREGFRGPATIVEGKSGFLRGYSDSPDYQLVLKDMGEVFHITRTSIKPHACCRYKQGPIDCVLELVHRHSIKAQDVDEVTVGILDAGWNIVAAPEEAKRNPTSVVDMQFSMPFGVAIAILYGRASLAEYRTEVAQRPEVRELMGKVNCVRDPKLDSRFPKHWPAWAEIRTRDGCAYRSEVEFPKGDPENALSWAELKAKFQDLTSVVISEGRQREIIARVEEMERLGDMRKLAELAQGG